MRHNNLFYDNVHFFSHVIWLKLTVGYVINGNPHKKISKPPKKKMQQTRGL